MSIENWIDEISKLFEIDDGRGGTVTSYRVFEKNEFPEAINDFPSAIHFPVDVTSHINEGASWEVWNGRSEFHLWPDISRAHFPELMRYFARIRNAAAGNVTLSTKVSWFLLRNEDGPSIEGPRILQYGGEEPHLGLIVYWQVKENVAVTVA